MINEVPLRTLLLICLLQKKMYPFSTEGLHRAYGSKRKISNSIRANYIFNSDGKLFAIEKIVIKEPAGEGAFSRFLNSIFGNWIVDLRLSEKTDIPLLQIKGMIALCVNTLLA